MISINLLQAPQGGGTFQLLILLILIPVILILNKIILRWVFRVNAQIKLLSKIAEKLGVEKSEIEEIIK
jgi:hypothetical protein